jgi:copper chaperone CopZ
MGILRDRKDGHMNKLSLEVDGMGCGGCIQNVRKTLERLPGVVIENVTVGSAIFTYDPAQASQRVIIEALAKAGYPARENAAVVATTGSARQGGHCGV